MSEIVVLMEIQSTDVFLEVLASQTVYVLVDAVCDHWLDEARGDDSGITEHAWAVTPRGDRGARRVAGPNDFVNEERREVAATKTSLADVGCLCVGLVLDFEYDYGHTTNAILVVRSTRAIGPNEPRSAFPRLGQSPIESGTRAREPPQRPRGARVQRIFGFEVCGHTPCVAILQQ